PAGPGLRASRPASSIPLPRPPNSSLLKTQGVKSQATTPSETTILTGITGHAEVDFTFGPEAGNQIVEATFPGNPHAPAPFVLNALPRLAGQPTKFTGSIQDNTSQAVGGAYCELTVAGNTNAVYSDAQGHFSFSDIPSGTSHLLVNGATATTVGTTTVPTN